MMGCAQIYGPHLFRHQERVNRYENESFFFSRKPYPSLREWKSVRTLLLPCVEPLTISFPNHIRATLSAHPDLMNTARVDVNAVPNPVGCFLLALLGISVLGVCNGELPAQDDMGREASMRVRWVVLQ